MRLAHTATGALGDGRGREKEGGKAREVRLAHTTTEALGEAGGRYIGREGGREGKVRLVHTATETPVDARGREKGGARGEGWPNLFNYIENGQHGRLN